MRKAGTLPAILRLFERIVASPKGKGLAFRLLPAALRDNLQDYRSADLIVSAGGTYLVEHYRLEVNLLHLALASSTGTPTVMFTQSLGPFRRPSVRRWLAVILPRMRLVLLRDRRSIDNLSDVGVPIANVRIAPDAAFALVQIDKLQPTRPARADERMHVAISVRLWRFPGHSSPEDADRNYRRSISAIVARLVTGHNARVTFVSTCQGVPAYEYDDSVVAREIADALPPDVRKSVIVNTDFHAPEALREKLGEFDFIVATRMHMAILGLCAGTPVLPIAYEFKTKELFEKLELGEWVLDIETLETERCLAALERFIVFLKEIRAKMIPNVIEQYRESLAVIPELIRIAGESDSDRLRT